MPFKYLNLTALLTLFITTLFGQTTAIKYGDNGLAGNYAAIRGFNMYYEIYGSGEPLLFIHPNGGSIKSFENQVAYFSKKYKVILADSRAQGKSTDTKDSLSYEMMSDDFNALLEHLKLKQVYVIGWSDGGINGLLLAMRHPDKVKKVAATGANLWPDTAALHPDVYKDILQTDKKLLDSMKKTKAPGVKNAYKVNHLMLLHPHIKPEQLHKISAPVLIIGGDHEAIPVKHTALIADAIPNSYLWIIPASGHATPVYQKDWFNGLIDGFFTQPFVKIEGKARYY